MPTNLCGLNLIVLNSSEMRVLWKESQSAHWSFSIVLAPSNVPLNGNMNVSVTWNPAHWDSTVTKDIGLIPCLNTPAVPLPEDVVRHNGDDNWGGPIPPIGPPAPRPPTNTCSYTHSDPRFVGYSYYASGILMDSAGTASSFSNFVTLLAWWKAWENS